MAAQQERSAKSGTAKPGPLAGIRVIELADEQARSAAIYATILAKFPETAKSGVVYQCAQQCASQSGYNYQLAMLRQQMGLDQSMQTASATNA